MGRGGQPLRPVIPVRTSVIVVTNRDPPTLLFLLFFCYRPLRHLSFYRDRRGDGLEKEQQTMNFDPSDNLNSFDFCLILSYNVLQDCCTLQVSLSFFSLLFELILFLLFFCYRPLRHLSFYRDHRGDGLEKEQQTMNFDNLNSSFLSYLIVVQCSPRLLYPSSISLSFFLFSSN